MNNDRFADPDAPSPSSESEPEWWATLDDNSSREVGPTFQTQAQAIMWAEHRQPTSSKTITIWERTVDAAGIHDRQVWPPEPPMEARNVEGVVRNLSAKLTDANRRRNIESDGRRGSGHVRRPAATMDPLTRMLTYDEVYRPDGTARFAFGRDGWPVREDTEDGT